MGLGPISAIYQARFNRYLHNRGQLDTSGSRVWAFLGDGETDEPESLGALNLAAREGLDNLTFVVNCNLQRLDGPVRGNGKIIQELEATFRGAGWNVIKVIWAREWDELLARDVDGAARPADERHARRRVPEVQRRGRRLHPRALLRAGPAPAQARRAPDRRRPRQAPPRRPRLPQGLRRLQGRDRVQGRARRSSSPRPSRAGRWARASRPATSPTRPRSCPRRSWRSSATGCSCRSPTPSSRTRRTTTPAPSRRRSSTCASAARRSAARSPSGSSAPGRSRAGAGGRRRSSPPAARPRSRRRWSSRGSCAT